MENGRKSLFLASNLTNEDMFDLMELLQDKCKGHPIRQIHNPRIGITLLAVSHSSQESPMSLII